MNYVKRISKLCLGTVQLGMNYGYYRRHVLKDLSLPSKDFVFNVLDYAKDFIDFYDTASVYGNAEELIGNFGLHKNIITKIKPDKVLPNPNILTEIAESTQKLKVKPYGVLFHTPEYIYSDNLVNELTEAKKSGLTEKVGVSVYEVEHGLVAAKKGVDIIQIPYSVLDRRFEVGDFFKICKDNNVKVFARSAFLQGLLLAPPEKIPDSLSYARPYVSEFQNICQKYQISFPSAALNFSLYNKGIDYVVFGVDDFLQLKDDIAIANSDNELSDECLDRLKEFKDVPINVIFPSLWK